jgi:hypothetical protein
MPPLPGFIRNKTIQFYKHIAPTGAWLQHPIFYVTSMSRISGQAAVISFCFMPSSHHVLKKCAIGAKCL